MSCNLPEAALEATNITGEDGRALNRQAKSAARSAFESNKQRFFGHLLTGMKCPTLIAAVTRDLAEGHAPVIQLVSTGEALLERRLAQIPPAEWGDVQVDVTPREYVLDYLQHSWPTQLFEVYADEGGDLRSRPALDEAGQPVVSRETVERRDRMIERLAALPPVQSALDQVVQHFGTGVVAEVTGRSRRIVPKPGPDGHDVLAVERRAKTARESGRLYHQVRLDDPSFPAPIFANLVSDDETGNYALIWNRPKRPAKRQPANTRRDQSRH